jgi:hypothetical protein
MFNFPTAVKSPKISLKLPSLPNIAELIPQIPALAFFPVIPALSADLNHGEGKNGSGDRRYGIQGGKDPRWDLLPETDVPAAPGNISLQSFNRSRSLLNKQPPYIGKIRFHVKVGSLHCHFFTLHGDQPLFRGVLVTWRYSIGQE